MTGSRKGSCGVAGTSPGAVGTGSPGEGLGAVFAPESLPEVRQDLSAVLPEARPDLVSAWSRELAAVQAVYSDRPAAVSVAAFATELVPVPRSFRQTGCMREPPA